MPIIQMMIILIVIGVVLALINKYGAAYIDANILKILNVAVVIGVIIWLLYAFGVIGYLSAIRIGK
jgi:hypothetical protein